LTSAADSGAPLFDGYVVVDWSAATTPRIGVDSIWIAFVARASDGPALRLLVNPPTRREAERILGDLLAEEARAGRSVLAGFDFPFAYSAGFAARLGLAGPPWRAVWNLLSSLLVEGERNANNRFAVAAELNRRISGAAFPFWGCPASCVAPTLAMICHREWDRRGLAEKRLTELRVSGPQPAWKLAGTGSAGSQGLTGMPVVARLRDDPRLAGRSRVWPFETGLHAPSPPAGIVFAEVYPSLVEIAPRPGEPKDSAQVRALAEWFAAEDTAGRLAALLEGDPALSAAERAIVEAEEGWVLGVVSGTRRPQRNARRSAR
jgi:precorrin-8X/cobalt-precorrin-8 methylmutase